jgi:hypothetical protein
MSQSDPWLIASTIGTLALALVATAALGVTVWQLKIGKGQFHESQQQQQDALEASQRPYLYPLGSLDVNMGADGVERFDFSHIDPGQTLQIQNSGNGIAFNVRGALVSPRPRVETGLAHLPQVRTIVLDNPLAVGDAESVASRAGPFQFGWDSAVTSDPNTTLAAPVDAIVRLTLTYQDIFGKTHASQFDYAHRGVTGPRWVFVKFSPKVHHDLVALAAEYDRVNLRNQTAFQAEQGARWRSTGEL